jgi:hypothetical protein
MPLEADAEACFARALNPLARRDNDAARLALEEARQRYRKLYKLFEEGRRSYPFRCGDSVEVGRLAALACALTDLGHLALCSSDAETALLALEQARPIFQRIGDKVGEATCLITVGEVAVLRRDLDGARQAYEEARQLFCQGGSEHGETACEERLAILNKNKNANELEQGTAIILSFEEIAKILRKEYSGASPSPQAAVGSQARGHRRSRSARPAHSSSRRMKDAEILKDITSLADKLGVPEADRPAFTKTILAFRSGARAVSRRARHEARVAKEWQPPSVPLPGGLQWPVEQFDKSPEFQKRGGIERHLDRVWRSLIEAGKVDMGILRAFYPSTALGIDSLKKRGGKLPDDLVIPQVSPGSGRRLAGWRSPPQHRIA